MRRLGLLHICLNNLPAAALPAAPALRPLALPVRGQTLGEQLGDTGGGDRRARRRVRRVPPRASNPGCPRRRRLALGALVQSRCRTPRRQRRPRRATTTPAKTSPGSTQTNASPRARRSDGDRAGGLGCVAACSRRGAAALNRVTRAHAAFFQSAASWARRHAREGPPPSRSNPSAPRDTSDRVRPWDRSPWRR